MPSAQELRMSPERVAELWRYDAQTGLIYWRKRAPTHAHLDDLASRPLKNGYMRVRHMNLYYGAHRVAWCLVYGKWPDRILDHINRNPMDNRIQNLRDVTYAENNKNRDVVARRSHLPLYVIARYGRFYAQVVKNRRCFSLGSFSDPQAAGEVAKNFVAGYDACISAMAQTQGANP